MGKGSTPIEAHTKAQGLRQRPETAAVRAAKDSSRGWEEDRVVDSPVRQRAVEFCQRDIGCFLQRGDVQSQVLEGLQVEESGGSAAP